MLKKVVFTWVLKVIFNYFNLYQILIGSQDCLWTSSLFFVIGQSGYFGFGLRHSIKTRFNVNMHISYLVGDWNC